MYIANRKRRAGKLSNFFAFFAYPVSHYTKLNYMETSGAKLAAKVNAQSNSTIRYSTNSF